MVLASAAHAQSAAPAAKPAAAAAVAPTAAQIAALKSMSSEDTPIGDILDNPAAKAILAKHLPDVVASDQVDMARGMTLVAIQSYSPDVITDAKLAAINADFKAQGK
ncbi:hypothetical protein ASC70_19430 [Caulobacter sp. Root343]|nr:hypothetical protein ASC62_23235 [Caulobacter sp. Root342]KQV64007.1 hypothetical protein ASC70_19430 [Caulobacter sp. Root343]